MEIISESKTSLGEMENEKKKKFFKRGFCKLLRRRKRWGVV